MSRGATLLAKSIGLLCVAVDKYNNTYIMTNIIVYNIIFILLTNIVNVYYYQFFFFYCK